MQQADHGGRDADEDLVESGLHRHPHQRLVVSQIDGRLGEEEDSSLALASFHEGWQEIVFQEVFVPNEVVIREENLVAPAEAQRLVARFEWHYTPKHGSWLDMAEIELGILSRQCLSQRIDKIEKLREETAAWEKDRDGAEVKVDWQFTTADARIKRKSLYPSMDE